MSDLLQRLRAYAAANPTDVKVIAETIQPAAELDAYEALARLSSKWRKRASAAADGQAIIDYTERAVRRCQTLRGLQAPTLDHEPFPLTRRVVKVCGVRVPAPRGVRALWPGW